MGSTETGGDDPDGAEGADASGGLAWYDTVRGAVLLAVDSVLVVVVVVGTTGVAADVLAVLDLSDWPASVRIPSYVYVYGVLGALGYVFTTVVREIDRSTKDLIHYNLRLFAALPLAAGVFLFGAQLLGADPPTKLLAGVAFVAGLFVNLTYERIGDLADRLLPDEETPAEGGPAGQDRTTPDGPGGAPPDDTTAGGGAGAGADGGPAAADDR